MESSNYPAMLYRGGVLSGAAADQRTVHSAEEEMSAGAEGFKRWESKPKAVNAPGKTDAATAAQAAFVAADKRKTPKGGKVDE